MRAFDPVAVIAIRATAKVRPQFPSLIALGTLLLFLNGSLGNASNFPQPPIIDASIAERKIDIALSAEGFNRSDNVENSIGGPFSRSIGDGGFGTEGTTVSSFASQKTYISSFSIRGRGEGEVKATVGSTGWAKVDGQSGLTVQFTIPVDHPFTVEGTLDSTHVGDSSGSATFLLSWIDAATGQIQSFLRQSISSPAQPGGETEFAKQGEIKAGTMVTIQISSGGSVPQPAKGGMIAGASFEFDFDLGDRDGDGLLDDWETDGIDINGDGTLEIDLRGYGADPDHKDIFVEIDVMSGVRFDELEQNAIYDVIEAFARAPASMVNNPDGRGGVTLHVEWDDGDAPGTISGDSILTGTGWPDEFDAIKTASFGSPEDRTKVFWQTEFRPIRLLVFRYCLWADSIIKDGKLISGIAEAPGNDFVVSAELVKDWWGSVSQQALAGTFMHELGHTLSLLHGGKGPLEQAIMSHKPNYQSVMSYVYQYPRDKMTAQGSNAKDFWFLDYSRKAAITLDENQLREWEGVDGTPGRYIIFNSDGTGVFPKLTIANAIASEIDWDNGGPFPDAEPVMRDISRFRSTDAVTYDAALVSYRDWDELWYHLSGSDHFNDGAARDLTAIQPNVDEATVLEIQAAEWVDMTRDSKELFFDDFEYGDPSAWSSRQP